ncbi:MAG: DUF2339 domain-containing protein [Planctomycetes bacterium]|nr:DUF2339 domain-containing protein [Planctomycetota bacterium]
MPLPRPTTEDDLRELKESALHLQSAFAALLRVIQKLEQLAPTRPPASMRSRPTAPTRVPVHPGTQSTVQASPPRALGSPLARDADDDESSDDAPRRKRVSANLTEKSNRNLSRRPSQESVMEMLIGERWLRRAGVSILLLGLFFLLKFAYDEGMLTPAALSMLFLFCGGATFCLGEVMLLFGWRKVAVVFFVGGMMVHGTIAWAHDLHALFPVWLTLLGYGVTTLLLAGAAMQCESLALALFAGICAGAGPIGVGVQHGLSLEMVGYGVGVGAVLLIAGWWKRWESIRIVAWGACATTIAVASLNTTEVPSGWGALACLASVYAVFTIEALVASRRLSDEFPWEICTVLHLNNIAVFGTAVHLMRDTPPGRLMAFCIVAAVGVWILAGRIKGLDLAPRTIRRAIRVDGAVFLAWLVPLYWDGYLVTVGWSVQAVVMALICRRMFGPLPTLYVAGLVVAAFSHLFMYEFADETLTELWTVRNLFDYTWLTVMAGGLTLTSCLVTVLLVGGRTTGPWERRVCAVLCGLGCIVLLVVSAMQTDAYWATAWWMMLAALWCVGSLRFPVAAVGALWLTAGAVVKYLAWDTLATFFDVDWAELIDPIWNRATAMGLLLVLLVMIARTGVRQLSPLMYRRMGGVAWRLGLTILAAFLFTWTGTFEILRAFGHEQFRARFSQPDLAFQVSLSIFWAGSAMVFLVVGLMRVMQSLRIMSIILFAVTLMKVLVLDLAYVEASYRVVLFMALGVLLVGASMLYHWLSSRVLGAAPAK